MSKKHASLEVIERCLDLKSSRPYLVARLDILGTLGHRAGLVTGDLTSSKESISRRPGPQTRGMAEP